jgi:hypothetical protein
MQPDGRRRHGTQLECGVIRFFPHEQLRLPIRTSRQRVRQYVPLASDVLDDVVVLSQRVQPSYLARRQVWLSIQVAKGVVAGLDGEVGTMEVASQFLDHVDDGQQLPVKGWVFSFWVTELS